MDEGNYISANLDEGYSPEAIANMDNALEEFAISLTEIRPEDANIAVFRGLKLTLKGRPRRLAELGNVESPDDPMKIELMIYNKEQIEEVLEFIKKNGFPAKNEPGSQFIHIRVPKPSRMQLEELGDEVIRRTNSAATRLMKIKTNTGLRIRAAMEKEYIDQRISGVAIKKIDNALERITKEMKIIGVLKRKAILGSFFKTIERDDADIIKVINKRIKLEKDKIAKEQELRIQAEALESQDQNIEKIETVNTEKVTSQIVDDNNIHTSN
jgi:ribosome recycling factor